MNLTVTVAEIVAPVFFLAAIGFFWVRSGLEYPVRFVTRLAMNVALPCLIFTALMQTEMDRGALADLLGASLITYGAITLGITGLVWGLRLPVRTYLSPLTFGNTGNLGLPLALFAFGPEGLSYAIIMFAVMAVWNFSFGIWVISGGSSRFKFVTEPLVISTLLGALFMWQGWETPQFMTRTLDMVGQLAIPLMLITLGVAVGRLSPTGIGGAFMLSTVKLVLCAALAWAVGLWFELDKAAFGVLVLQAATPVAVTSYLLAEKFEAGAEQVAALVVVSTLLSVAALPLLLAALL